MIWIRYVLPAALVVAGFVVLFLYLFQLSRKEASLRRRITDLQATVEEHWKK